MAVKPAVVMIVALLCACLVLVGFLWRQSGMISEQAGRIADLERNVATVVSANRQANATIFSLQRSANATAAVTVDWAEWTKAVHSAGRDAAIAIEGEKDAAEILDAPLPADIERHLDRVRAQARAAGGQRSVSGGDNASGPLSSGAEYSGAPGGKIDTAQNGPMDGRPAGNSGSERGR